MSTTPSPLDRRRARSWRSRLTVAALAAVPLAAWGMSQTLQDDTAVFARVERADLVIGVDLEGELEAVESELIGPPNVPNLWNFKISWMAPEGKTVQPGEPVLRFDTTELKQRLQNEQVEMESAKGRLEKLRQDLEVKRRELDLQLAEAEARLRQAEFKINVPEEVSRRNELAAARIDHRLAQLEIESLHSQIEYAAQRAKADLEATQRRYDRARGRVEELQNNIQRMSVTAQRPGTLTYVADWRGNKQKVGDSVWQALKVLEIPDLTRMRAAATVAESDVGRLAVGQPVRFRLDAHPDHEYRATVAQIRRSVGQKSRSNPQMVIRLVLDLEATDPERMRPGMRLRGTVETERIPDSLLVPEDAVFARPDGAVVYVDTLWGRRAVQPEFGRRNRESFAVVSGLEEGERVLRRGLEGDS